MKRVLVWIIAIVVIVLISYGLQQILPVFLASFISFFCGIIIGVWVGIINEDL